MLPVPCWATGRTAGQGAIQVGQGLARGEVLVQAARLGHALNLEAGNSGRMREHSSQACNNARQSLTPPPASRGRVGLGLLVLVARIHSMPALLRPP